MKRTAKYILITTIAVIPVLLIFSGLNEQPVNKTVKVVPSEPQLFQKTDKSAETVKQPLFSITSVAEYEALSSFGKLPDIYSGLSIDGELKTDKNGNLIISEEVKLLFDFFLSTRQTEGLALCSDRIREYINLTLEGSAAEKALELFSLYKTYLVQKGMAENGLMDDIDLTSPEKTLGKLKESLFNRIRLSNKIFGEKTANQLFNTSHKTALYFINKIEISQNISLPENEKAALIAEEKDHLSPMQRIRVDRDQQEESFDSIISDLHNKGAVQDIFDLRKEKFGESAARKLSLLDNKKKELNNRIELFLIKKKSLLNGVEPDCPEIQNQINELRKNSFEEWELSALRKAEVIIDRQS